ncbi:MAG: GtrA family protein [Bacteroidales bacterium]|nr:GtrA family protein [Bacteroidales bacterium]
MPSKHTTALQFVRYLIVGGMNTAVTLIVIFALKSLAGMDPYLSNAAGYIAGLINSFLWNRGWVFRSHGNRVREGAAFLAGFGICYLIQLLTVWGLTHTGIGTLMIEIPIPLIETERAFTLSGYGISTLAGMAVYTIANFIYNRLVTFRKTA